MEVLVDHETGEARSWKLTFDSVESMGDLYVIVEVCLLLLVDVLFELILEVIGEVRNRVHLVAVCDHEGHDVALALRTWLLKRQHAPKDALILQMDVLDYSFDFFELCLIGAPLFTSKILAVILGCKLWSSIELEEKSVKSGLSCLIATDNAQILLISQLGEILLQPIAYLLQISCILGEVERSDLEFFGKRINVGCEPAAESKVFHIHAVAECDHQLGIRHNNTFRHFCWNENFRRDFFH